MKNRWRLDNKRKLLLPVGTGLLAILALAGLEVLGSGAQEAPSGPPSRIRWNGGLLEREPQWYASAEARAIADNVIEYQSPEGGWPKNTDLAALPPSPESLMQAVGNRANTIDNGATTTPMRFLAIMIQATGEGRYREAFARGLDYLFGSQYPNGGWPQFYPLRRGYYSHITFNDNAMVSVLTLLRNVAAGKRPYAFLDEAPRAKAAAAVKRGIDCILATQIKQNDKLTAWCAQYDEQTLEPAWARAYEPPSLSGSESVGIVRFLMGIEQPTPEIISAIEGAVSWFRAVAIHGIRLEPVTSADGERDRRAVADAAAKPLWARFYELGTNRPIFLGRDSVVRYALSEIEYERRRGYVYYGYWPATLLTEDYPAWRAKHLAPGTYTNPILAGDWSDPGLIRVGHDYYSVRSTFGWQPGLPIAHSRDLLHWEYIGHGFVSHPKLLPGDTRNGIWGVEMGWNPNTKQFLIYAPTRDGEVFVYYADRPEGPYQVRSLGANLGIDPGFFADDDGRLYFMTNRALIYELESDGLSIKRPVKQIDRTPYKLFEGPDIFKHGGYYYLLLSDGGTLPHEPSTITSLRARSLEGPWESDPGNPVMFSTDSGARFESPAHGTIIDTHAGEWYIVYHAHEPAYYTLGRQFLMEPLEWTADGWWRPAGGKIPATSAKAPALAPAPLRLEQSDEFERPELGLQWFFTCAPDFSGKAWSLRERPGMLRIRTQKGDLHSLEALPGVFQQRVIDKAFTFETRVAFDARDGREAAGLHMYHDPLMNFWLATTVMNGEKRIAVGKHTLGVRQELWSVANPYGDQPVHLRIVVSDPETATFFHSSDGSNWRQLGESIYFGASGHHLRDGKRGDPDLGWVGRYKEPNLTPEQINGLPENQSQKVRMGNTWTAATFGVFAVQDSAKAPKAADFDYLRVSAASRSVATRVKPRVIATTDGEIDDQSSMVRFLMCLPN